MGFSDPADSHAPSGRGWPSAEDTGQSWPRGPGTQAKTQKPCFPEMGVPQNGLLMVNDG